MRHICWTRVGTLGGEEPSHIVQRKERERKELGGIFFWQVGNKPPVKDLRTLAEKEASIEVIFSRIKGKPKEEDQRPEQVLVWQSYFDFCHEVTRPLPDGALVTSGGLHCDSYALVCRSDTSLSEMWKPKNGKKKCFDPTLLRKKLACQQITVLSNIEKTTANECKKQPWMNRYREEMKAQLDPKRGYWVCLQDPKVFDGKKWEEIRQRLLQEYTSEEWLNFVRKIRSK